MEISKCAELIWKEKINNKNTLSDIERVFHPMWVEYKKDGKYKTVIKNNNVTAVVKKGVIIEFEIEHILLLEITKHALLRWRERINKYHTDEDIRKIFNKLNHNGFNPSINGKYLINCDNKNIVAVITNSCLITFWEK